MSEGVKYDNGKPQMDLLPREALVEVAKVLSVGASKYGRYNWRKGMQWSRITSACLRHLTAFNDGQDKDPETGISHLAHAACNLMFLIDYEKNHPELDDRYGKEAAGTKRDGELTGIVEATASGEQKSKEDAVSCEQANAKICRCSG